MKENKYDDSVFFEQYSHMPRSEQGLSAAGEWPALKALLPELAGKRVLDLGCGFGWHCRYAAEHGAARVLGTDLSQRMLERARAMTDSPVVEYRRAAIEDTRPAPAAWDVVLSSLALHYVEDYAGVCRMVWDALSPGGWFIFSAEHPVFTAQGPQDWQRDAGGAPLHWPVDRYFEQGPRDAVFLGEHMRKYHRTVTGYVQPLLARGFALEALVEPQPAREMLDAVPGMADELRRPMMLILKARKPRRSGRDQEYVICRWFPYSRKICGGRVPAAAYSYLFLFRRQRALCRAVGAGRLPRFFLEHLRKIVHV